MTQIVGDITAVNSTLMVPCDDHFGSADVNGAASITLAAGASGTVVLEMSQGLDASGNDIWVQLRVFNDTTTVGAFQDTMVGAAGTQHWYAEIVGARKVRIRKSATAASCYAILTFKAA